jgi:hypothetical protein
MEVQATAAIKEVVLSPTRSSPRLAHFIDKHTLSKAERRVAEKNLELKEGNLLDTSLGSFNFFDAVARISHLGIYYGINDNERVSSVKQFLEGGGVIFLIVGSC